MSKSDKRAATELARLLGVSANMFIQFLTETKSNRAAIAYAWATDGTSIAARPFFAWLAK